MKNKIYICVCLLLVLCAVCAWAEGEPFVSKPEISAQIVKNPKIFDEKLVLAMNELLHNPATLTLEIAYDTPETLSQGWVTRAFVHTSGGNVENLILHKADIEFNNIQINTTDLFEAKKIRPLKMQDINMNVVIKESDLNHFLRLKSRSIKVNKPRIELKKNVMELSGSTKFGLVKVEFWATGNLEIDKNGVDINFRARRLKVNRMTMPRSFVGMIMKKINPVLSLDDFPFNLHLSEIRTEPNQITFTSYRQK